MTTKPNQQQTVAAPAKRPGGALAAALRAVSFIAALGFMAVIVLYPRAIADDMSSVPHGSLVGLLCGMSICWVYGLGFVPRAKVLQRLFSPVLGWALMLGFGAKVFLQ